MQERKTSKFHAGKVFVPHVERRDEKRQDSNIDQKEIPFKRPEPSIQQTASNEFNDSAVFQPESVYGRGPYSPR